VAREPYRSPQESRLFLMHVIQEALNVLEESKQDFQDIEQHVQVRSGRSQ